MRPSPHLGAARHGRRQGQHCVIFAAVEIGEGTRLGNLVLIRSDTRIGRDCVIGSHVDIEGRVRIGDFVSLQSGCYITRGVVIEDEVSCGPRVVRQSPEIVEAADGPAPDDAAGEDWP